MLENVKQQQGAYDEIYAMEQLAFFDFHTTTDPYTRYLRDRRLYKALNILKKHNDDILSWSVLLVCGGVGGEALFFKKHGFKNVTVSDISENSLKICNLFDASMKTMVLDGENLDLPDNSYDLVVVQDGLHHLPRPVSGFTEMLRVAKKAIIVIEAYDGLVSDLLGIEWEEVGDAINFTFRWNKKMITQTTKSFLLKNYKRIEVLRFWDHDIVWKVVNKIPKPLRLNITKAIYGLFRPFNKLGNMMVAVVLK